MTSKWVYQITIHFTHIDKVEINGKLNIIADNYDIAENKVKIWATKHGYEIQRISLTDNYPCWE